MTHIFIWAISLLCIAGVIIRPFKWPEAIWAVAGALLLLVFGLLSPREGWIGVAKGLDVYLFLTGMMLLAETAREERLFDWLAAHATQLARGSAMRLFGLIYLVGILVTVFLSNDATAVVLTPAVAAASTPDLAVAPAPAVAAAPVPDLAVAPTAAPAATPASAPEPMRVAESPQNDLDLIAQGIAKAIAAARGLDQPVAPTFNRASNR